jgi:hypothetical protein
MAGAPIGPPPTAYGAAHDSETQYLFDLSNPPLPGVLSGPQQALAEAACVRLTPNRRAR